MMFNIALFMHDHLGLCPKNNYVFKPHKRVYIYIYIYIYNSIVGENPIKELRKKEKTFL